MSVKRVIRSGAVATSFIAAVAVAAAACGGGGTQYVTGAGGHGAGGSAGAAGAAGGMGGAGGAGAAGAAGAAGGGTDGGAPDLATDFGTPEPDVIVRCPTADGDLAAADPALVIDDFDGTGPLDGRIRMTDAMTVKEQFDVGADAKFTPAPAIEGRCGAAAPGAAHIRGVAAPSGSSFAIVFSTPAPGGKPIPSYDASATRGVTFRIALGAEGAANKIYTVQVNLAKSTWDYTKDVVVAGTQWQSVTILWSDLQAAPAAPAFSPAALNQLVIPFVDQGDVDLYLDDIAFVK
jgi:hypothetical protein